MRPVLVGYAAFVLIGVSAGASGVLLVIQMGDYGVDRAAIGATFFTSSAGFMLASLGAGALIHRFGVRIALAAGGAGFVLTALYLATRPPFPAFVLVQLVTGYATGVLESALSVYLAALPNATTLLNRLHAFWGVGALLGPALATWITGFAPWTTVWLVLALAGVPLVVGFLAAYPRRDAPAPEPDAPVPDAPVPGGLVPDGPVPDAPVAGGLVPDGPVPGGLVPDGPVPGALAPEPGARVSGARPGGSLLGAALRDRGVLLGAAMLAVYVGLELGVGNWGFSYLTQARGLATSLAGYSVSGYWLGLTLGRFLISPVAARLGATAVGMMYACLAGVTAAAALAWFSPAAVLTSAALMLLGFFLGPVFPTTMAVAPGLTQARLRPTAIGVMNAGSVVGGAALPWLAGAIAQDTGIWVLLPYAVTLALLQFVVWRSLAARIRR
jgi:fucose permease